MTCKYQPDLAGVDIYCSCGEILEQQGLHAYLVERVSYNAYIIVKPCRRCLKIANVGPAHYSNLAHPQPQTYRAVSRMVDWHDKMIAAAEKYVFRYGNDDPRQDIYCDLMNAFFAGAEWAKKEHTNLGCPVYGRRN